MKLPPQPHKPRFYYYSMQPSEVILHEGGIEVKSFMGIVQQMKSDHGYLEQVADWHTVQTYETSEKCFEEVMKDMSNPSKP